MKEDTKSLKEKLEKVREEIAKLRKNQEATDKRLEQKEKRIAELEREREEWLAIEKNAELYGNYKIIQEQNIILKTYEDLLKSKNSQIENLGAIKDKLIEMKDTKYLDKARSIKQQKKNNRKEEYIKKVAELKSGNPSILAKDIISELGISKMTYYNLGLDKV